MGRRVFAAVDIGASGGRVMAGVLERGSITLAPVHRFANGVREHDGHLRWDITAVRGEVLAGLAALMVLHPEMESIGIDTWGVDYGLLDADGRLLGDPIAYRDDRTAKVVDLVHARVAPEELFAVNGLQFLPFNTIYQFAAEQRGPVWARATHALLLPDLLAFWLTGSRRSELTNASTTGLLDVRAREWSTEILRRLDIPLGLLPAIEAPGEVRGIWKGRPVTTVGSHDTASAVVGVPATDDRFAYISSGTWSLVGLELAAPVLTRAAHEANFTNELGVDGRVRFLRNVGGLWLLQESMRAWGTNDVASLVSEAASLPAGGPVFDVDDAAFLPPGDMPYRIAAAAGLSPGHTRAQLVRSIVDSLAAAFARAVGDAARLAGARVDVIHLVGGGSQNDLLCQLTADAAGLPVVAGPVEATALGNVAVQARAHGALPPSLEAIRAAIARSTRLRRFEPS